MNRAVFLDRDGVLVEDIDLLTRASDLRVLRGVPPALGRLRQAGFRLIVVSNQTVVARGLATEAEVREVNAALDQLLRNAGAPPLDGIYFCPHHPRATLPAYRMTCDCRKPRPGLILQAAREHGIDPASSFLVGDRLTDIAAGAHAGCRTVLVETGRHTQPPIETAEPLEPGLRPDFVCPDLGAAADWILQTA